MAKPSTIKGRKRATKAKERLQVMLNRDTKQDLVQLAASESRSESAMGEILIMEAIEARGLPQRH
ncbi:hypothetical protein [Marinobacterium sedimentorum]|uniref:hypothetical protein n=1 Tax=Marinobacterium sedimentorum TaxID=2927804 RepID=UPI0020C6C1C0|nr:hypothetical protein [Marinobacterium sedimentorum]MCP8687730.1 hypothetical protein [Marinobacterium sedimentorum]